MPDEEMEEKGMYSPRQIKAYKERFPTCDKVSIIEYKDGSRVSRCIYWAFGDEHGQCGLNTSNKCFDCASYSKREERQSILVKYDTTY
jgi:ribosome-associated toxin RatA of RatAB toxin-antitoxin module